MSIAQSETFALRWSAVPSHDWFYKRWAPPEPRPYFRLGGVICQNYSSPPLALHRESCPVVR